MTDASHLRAWDVYYHQQPATKAVRNRKAYFHSLLDQHNRVRERLRVLNLASGPGRCMFEWLKANPNAECLFECVEIDEKAIVYATDLNQIFAKRISFHHSNILHWRPLNEIERYDVIWASGIFDYFSDRIFRSLLGRLLRYLHTEGELIIGNFSRDNPSRPYMEIIGDWALFHRSENELLQLAMDCGIDSKKLFIGREPEGAAFCSCH
ncbi:MAG TPA: class I SAM-dependent methyltransferase [Pirellulaceae bacterium]|nr:class I SAM-dependent methyltransferase [Pirellulaceae bacterium]